MQSLSLYRRKFVFWNCTNNLTLLVVLKFHCGFHHAEANSNRTIKIALNVMLLTDAPSLSAMRCAALIVLSLNQRRLYLSLPLDIKW